MTTITGITVTEIGATGTDAMTAVTIDAGTTVDTRDAMRTDEIGTMTVGIGTETVTGGGIKL